MRPPDPPLQLFCSPRIFQVSDILCTMVRNSMDQECSCYVLFSVGIARDDDQIKAHEVYFLRKIVFVRN